MTFGINTFLFTSPFTTESLPLLEKFKAWGFDSVEIGLEDPAHVDPKALKKALNDNGLICGSICAAVGPDRDLRGSAADQKNGMDYMKGVMDVMAEVNCPVMMGPVYSAVGRAEITAPDDYKKQWETVTKNLHALAVYAAERNIKIAIEPLNRYETDFINTCEQALKLIDSVSHPSLRMMLDTYHMNIEEKDSARAILMAGDKLVHFHACGCDRGTPGNDHINWDGIVSALKQIKYDGSVVIESFIPDIKMIAKAASIWRKFEPSSEDIAVKGIKFLKSKLN